LIKNSNRLEKKIKKTAWGIFCLTLYIHLPSYDQHPQFGAKIWDLS